MSGLSSVTRAVAVRVCCPSSEPMYDTLPSAVSVNAAEATRARSPTRTSCRSLGAITNSAQTVRMSDSVKMLAVSASASPSAICFSTMTPSNGARISRMPRSLDWGDAPAVRNFCSAFWTAMRASSSAVRAC
ncbi:hypothetical protein G6F31_019481 [Rhizopus arrhizus]|nr:hypothetical protein G6F31_019481 [Rhizopus arrhizus]